MAQPVLNIKLVDATNVTVTVTNGFSGVDYLNKLIAVGGGFSDDAGLWHPASAIVSVTIS